ncbi:MAG: hypothetical protein LN590_05135 [Rickettsia endosymbiont of Glossina mortisans submortisans]|nr:hypothetical protein [Rickettsia endosymbiont of Glossina mortisans submortisans]
MTNKITSETLLGSNKTLSLEKEKYTIQRMVVASSFSWRNFSLRKS